MKQYSFKYKATTALAAVALMFVTTLTFFFWKGAPTWSAIYALVPVLLLGAGIISAGKKEVNCKCTGYLYIFKVVSPYVWIGICSMIGILPMHTIICFLTIAVALGCATTMKKSIGQGSLLLEDLRSRTITLYMMFSVLLSISLVAAKFI